MRQGIVLTLVLVLGAVVSSAAAGQQPRASCPNGYEMAAVPQDEAAMRMFSRIAAGLDADLVAAGEREPGPCEERQQRGPAEFVVAREVPGDIAYCPSWTQRRLLPLVRLECLEIVGEVATFGRRHIAQVRHGVTL